jgi:hypothetical protein
MPSAQTLSLPQRSRTAISAPDPAGDLVGLIGLHVWQQHHRRAELGYDIDFHRDGTPREYSLDERVARTREQGV